MKKYQDSLIPVLFYFGLMVVVAIVLNLLRGGLTASSFGWAMMGLGMTAIALALWSLTSDDVTGMKRTVNYRMAITVSGAEEGEEGQKKSFRGLGLFGNGMVVGSLALGVGGLLVFV